MVRPTLAIVPVYLRSEPELDVLLKCLVSLQATAPDAQVLIVDDHSPAAGLAQMVEAAADELRQAYVRKDANSGFAATVNVGLEVAGAHELDAVSATRSQFGAVQNRLGYTLENAAIYQENLTASESRIRDVDMASEMVNFTKLQILQQAGTSMLAQANSSSQGVLSLLR